MNKHVKKDVGAILHADGTTTFRVWAPFATSVDVTGTFNNWARLAMAKEDDGYWFVEAPDAKSGQEYNFIIKNDHLELVRNDPRTLQIATSQGNSVLVSSSFDWEDDRFTPPPPNQQIIYELHVGTFYRPDPSTIGTFADVAEKLDYLADLGINMIELMPVASMFQNRGWGYAPEYIYSIESLYGGRQEFLKFVKAAHQRGIGVIVDVVYNHIGAGEEVSLWQYDGWSANNKGGIYFYNDERAVTPWGDTRLDYGRPEVRQYITDNVKMWLRDYHVDGLRVDSTIYMRNTNGHDNDPEHDIPEAWSLLQEITAEAKKASPNVQIVAEDSGGNSSITKPCGEGGAGFTAQWDIRLPGMIRQYLSGAAQLDEIANSITHGEASRRVVYCESHDSAANGQVRLGELLAPGDSTPAMAQRKYLAASALALTIPGIPMLFQGAEFMEKGSFNDWQALDWSKCEQHTGLLLAHKHLIALRKNSPSLVGNNLEVIQANSDGVLAFRRWQNDSAGSLVVINMSESEFSSYEIPVPQDGEWHTEFCSDSERYTLGTPSHDPKNFQPENNRITLHLQPYSVIILSQ